MESFEYLKQCASGKEAWLYRHCAVMIDGMKIKKYIEYDASSKSQVGFINFGPALDSDSETLATEALVIMAVGIHGHWKVPLGYFLVNGISATAQLQLVRQAYELLYESGVTAISLTLDGHQTNVAMIRKLGCSTDPGNIVHFFPHPKTHDPVYVFLDACHGLKLIRNQFCALQSIIVPDVGHARWSHLVELNKVQNKEGLRAGNRLTDRHIQFQQQKMKVSNLFSL